MKNIRYKLFLLITIFGLITLVSGTSYAILKGNTKAENEQIVETGKIKLKLIEKFNNSNLEIKPMSDVDGLLLNSYEFNIKNIGDGAANFDLKLINEVPEDYTGKVLSEEYIKIGLEINGVEHGPFSLAEVNNVIDSGVLYQKELINYELRIWLDEEKQEELSNMIDYKVFIKLKVEATQRPNSMDKGIETKVFNYTGNEQEYIITRDGYYYIELAGASGGPGHKNGEEINNYGLGAITSGYIYLESGEKLYLQVGGQGAAPTVKTCTNTTNTELEGTGGNGGYNGGGTGGNDSCSASNSANDAGGGGGGATDIRLVSGKWNDTSSLISRIMVAAGGGGGTFSQGGGHGSFLYGRKAYKNKSNDSNIGTIPNQTSGYSFGKGGPGVYCSQNIGSGGHGGGYYGGYISAETCAYHEGGIGGSSYISGYAGVNSVENKTTITHTNDTMHYSDKYFIAGNIIEGQNDGNGYAKITYVKEKPTPKTTQLNDVRYIKDCTNYSTSNNYNIWTEIQAMKDGVNIAKGKTVTSTYAELSSRPYSLISDGDITHSKWSRAETQANNQCVIVDLGDTYDLDEVVSWNYFGYSRVYYNHYTYVSSDNSSWTKISDESNIETSNGRRKNRYNEVYNGPIEDGLIIWYDGFANTGVARNPNTTTWKNLASSSYDGTINGASWGVDGDYLYFDGTDDYVMIDEVNPENITMEIVYKKDTLTTNGEVILGNIHTGGYSIGINATSGTLKAQYYINGEYRIF